MAATQSWIYFALGSALFAALTAILGKIGVADIPSNLATLIRTCVIIVMIIGIVNIRGEWQPISSLPRNSLLMLVLSGIATGLSWLCYYRALQLAPASKVAPIDKLSVLFVIIFATIFLREALSWKLALGALLITAGAVVIAL